MLFCAGLGITAYDSYVTVRYVAALRRMTERFRDTETWRPTEEHLHMTDDTYKVVLLRSVWGVLLSAGLAAVPWGCFRLARWIVRGFQSPVR